jgi:hypothetical protein
MPDADFLVSECGDGTALTPVSARARAACRSRIPAEPWQWMFGSVVVDYRKAFDLVADLQADGFTFSKGRN